MSFLHIDMTQVVEILPHVREQLTYPTYIQYHECWWPGNAISNHDICYVEPD